jgi:hypothetical protein
MATTTFTDLQNGFFNAFTTGLGLSGSSFQLLQPSTPLLSGTQADQALWDYFNNIPPFSLTQNYLASGGNQFFSDYRGLLSALQGTPNTFRQDIGDEAYAAWIQYLPTLSPRPTSSQLAQVFFDWAMVYYPDLASVGASDLAQIALDPITSAQMTILSYPSTARPDWNLGYAALVQQLGNAPSRAFTVSSSTMDSNVSKTWTQGRNSGFFGLWGGSSYESKESSKFAADGVRVSASFDHVMTFQASPGPWYSSAAMGDAYSHQSGLPWKSTSPINWQNTFDSKNGNMARFSINLIVADTMKVQVDSFAKFSSDERQTIRNNSNAGLWPFYTQGGSSGSTTQVNFNDDGQMSVTITSDRGIPVVLGVNVAPVSQYVGHGVVAAQALRTLALAA